MRKTFGILLLATMIAVVSIGTCFAAPAAEPTESPESSEDAIIPETKAEPASDPETSGDDLSSAINNNIYLTLVNPSHKVPDNWLDLITLVPATNSLGEEYLVEEETLAHFEDLREDLLEEGIDIELDSGYRSVEEQIEIWDEFSIRYGDDVGLYVAVPGTSEHHTGLAVDVFLIDGDTIIRDNDDLFAATELFAEVHKHLADHGFILRVPEGKEEACEGLGYEPWHFRYVGEEAAREMTDQGLVLEEYLAIKNADSAAVDTAEAPAEEVKLLIELNGSELTAKFIDNPSSKAFIEKLNEGPLEVELHDYGNFEKVGPLPWDLPRSDTDITTVPGDIILYQGNQITIYYDENSWNFTRLAAIPDMTTEDLLAILGDGNVTAIFSLDN